MVLEIRVGDVIRLKKKHPCGGFEWRVIRIGADIGIKCLTCSHFVMIPRSELERRIKTFASRGE